MDELKTTVVTPESNIEKHRKSYKTSLKVTFGVVIALFLIVSSLFLGVGLGEMRIQKIKASVNELNYVSNEYESQRRNQAIQKLRETPEIYEHIETFSAKLMNYVKEDYYEEDADLLISPISIYLAFVMQYECLTNEDKVKLRDFLCVTEEDINLTKDLLDSLLISGDKVALDIFNSIWLNSGLDQDYNPDILESLGKKYYTNVIEANFLTDNQTANKALRQYVKEKTRGLIDNDYDIDETVSYLLVNALYVEDIWSSKEFTQKSETFTKEDGFEKVTMFNISEYHTGKPEKEEKYTFQRIISENGFVLSFILPNDGYTIGDVYNEETIKLVNNYIYNYVDSSLLEKYYTRCIFPSFEIGSDIEIQNTIVEHYDIDFMFNSFKNLLTDNHTFIDRVIHQTKLEINKNGFKGAAVTIIDNKATSAGVQIYKDIYFDFLVNKPFGIILSSSNGVIIFTGIVNNIK